jgi:hypothetical protein
MRISGRKSSSRHLLDQPKKPARFGLLRRILYQESPNATNTFWRRRASIFIRSSFHGSNEMGGGGHAG